MRPPGNRPAFCCLPSSQMDWILVLKALCLVLVIEGLALCLSPRHLREAALQLARLNDRVLRTLGLMAMVCGAGLLILLKHTS